MVAVFTGLGAGFERGSAAALGGQGLLGSSSLGRGGEAAFFNAGTGNLVLTRQDEFLVGRGPDVSIARTYNSQGALDENGDHWRQSTDRRIIASGTINVTNHTVVRVSADGSEITYTYNNWGDGSYYRATDGAGAHDKLVYTSDDSGVWTWTDGSSQIREVYKAADNWFISQQSDLDGNVVKFNYASGKLVRIATANDVSGAQSAIEYGWTGANITTIVTKYTDLSTSVEKTLTRTTYAYDGDNRLITVTVDETPENTADNATAETLYTISYTYDGSSKRVASVTQSDGSSLAISYAYDSASSTYRVSQFVQTVGVSDTRTTSITYTDEGNGLRRTEVTDPRGQVTKLWSKIATGELTKVAAPPAVTGATAQTTQFAYDAKGNVTSVTNAAGGVTSYHYDANGNNVRITDPNTNKIYRIYDVGADYEAYVNNNADLLSYYSSTIASSGRSKADWGEEHWMFSGAGEGRLTPFSGQGTNALLREVHLGEIAGIPHVLSLRYIYDAENHLRYAMSGDGRVTEYRYTAQGEVEFRIEYPEHIYNLDPHPDGWTRATLSEMNDWRDGLTDRSGVKITKYIYGARGNVLEAISYGGATSAGELSLSEGFARNVFVYDQAGLLRSKFVESQVTETFVYDGLGRLTASTDLNGGTTTIVFNDAETTTQVTTAQSFTTISTYNKAGELISRAASSAPSTTTGAATYLYDKHGNIRRTIDETNRKTFHLYDNAGRKVADIGHDGQVTEYKYDASNRVVASVRYVNPLSAGQIATLDSATPVEVELGSVGFPRPTADNVLAGGADLWSWTVYDAAGRIVETISGDGAVTAYAYDTANRLVSTTSYYNKLSAGQVATLIATPPSSAITPTANATRDRITRSFYDSDGRLIGALNADGYLSEIVYDGAGQKITEVSYANATSAALRATGWLHELRGSITLEAHKDVRTSYVYDGQGLLRYKIDALSRVTEYAYKDGTNAYAVGLVRKTIAYAAPVPALANHHYATVKAAVAALASSTNDRVTHAVYNDRAQLAYSVDEVGAVVGFVYDNEGKVIRSTQFASFVTLTALGSDAAWKANLDTWAASNGAGARITRNYYNARGDLRYSIDGAGYVTRFSYDEAGRQTSLKRFDSAIAVSNTSIIDDVDTATSSAAGSTTTYAYDHLGRLSDITDGNGSRRHISYLANGVKATETRAYGQGADESVLYFEYDQSGRLISETNGYGDDDSATTLYSYDGLGNIATLTDARSKVTSFEYDRVGRVTKRTDALSGTTTFEYDAFGDVVRSTNEKGASSYLYFDRLGQITLSIDAGGYATQKNYNSFGEIASVKKFAVATTDATIAFAPALVENSADSTVTFAYDKAGRLITQTNALSGAVTHQLNARGNIVKTTDARGYSSYFYYDVLDRVTLTIDAEGYATATTYNAYGAAVAVKRYADRATGIGDVNVTPTLVGNALDATTAFEYDDDGQLKKTTDALGAETEFSYDLRGNLIKTTNAIEGVTERTYDDLDRLIEETVWFDDYNAVGGAKSITKFTYDDAGNLTQKIEAFGQAEQRTTLYEYDDLNRLRFVTRDAIAAANSATGVAVTPVEEFKYDAAGRLIEKKDASGARTLLWYNALGQLTYELTASAVVSGATKGALTRNDYDANGNVVERRAFGELVTLPLTAEGSPPSEPNAYRRTLYTYDKLNRVVEVKTPDVRRAVYSGSALNVDASDVTLTATYEYDANNNVIRTVDGKGAVVFSYFDKLGRKTSQVDAQNYRTDWTYDTNGNVLSERRYANPLSSAPTTAPLSIANLMRGGDLTQGASVIENHWDGGAGGNFALAIETIDGAAALTMRKVGGAIHSWDPGYVWGGVLVSVGGEGLGGNFSVAPGETVAFSLEGKQLAAGAHKVYAGIVFLDASGARFSHQGFVLAEADNWETLSGVGLAPPGTVAARIELAVRRTDGVTNGAMDFAIRKIQFNKLTDGAASAPAWTAPTVSVEDRVTTFTYDKMGRRLTESRASVAVHNGAGAHTSANAVITYTYNALGQVASKVEASNDKIAYAYDLGGRLTEEKRTLNGQSYLYTDAGGANVAPIVQYQYNALSDLTQSRALGSTNTNANAVDRTTTFTYGAGGRLLSKQDAAQFTRTYIYDAAERVVREQYIRVTPSGSAEEAVGYDYDLQGRVIAQGVMAKVSGAYTRSVTNSLGNSIDTVVMRYNAYGEVSERGVNDKYAEKFEYDNAGRIVRTNSGDGVWKYFMYDGAGNQTLMIKSTGADLGAAASDTLAEVLALWTGGASTIATTNVSGVTATITRYDGRNAAVEVLEPQRQLIAGGSLANLRTARVYNAFGEVVQEVNANGFDGSGAIVDSKSIQYAYNTMGRLIQITSPAVSITSETGAVTNNYRPVEHRYYDASGRLTGERDANGNRTLYTLLAGSGHNGANALITEVQTHDGAVTRTKYDIMGDARRIESPLYHATNAPQHVTLQTFDSMARLLTTTQSNGLVEHYGYDGLGQRIWRTNSQLDSDFNRNDTGTWTNLEKTTYDLQGRITQLVAFGGDTTSYEYGWSSALATGGMETFGGRTQKTTLANAKTMTEQTDMFGRAISKTDFGANVTGFTYDKAGRLTQRTGGAALNLTYFNTNKLATMGALAQWSSLPSHPNWKDSDTYVTAFGYDTVGNLTREQLTVTSVRWWLPGGFEPEPYAFNSTNVHKNATATFDALGRIESWTETGSAATPVASHHFRYDANGNVRRSIGNFRALNAQGVAASTNTQQDYWYRYDSQNRMVTSKGKLVGGAIVRGEAGGVDTFYDAAGNRAYTLTTVVTGITTQITREDYVYDAEGRVIEVKARTDIHITSEGGIYDPVSAGAKRADFTYDSMGRVTQQRDYDTNGTTILFQRDLSYNAKGQITTETSITKRSTILYKAVTTYDYGLTNLYALGAPRTVTTVNHESTNGGASWVQKKTNLTTNFYEWRDGALLDTVSYKPDTAVSTTHTSTYNYSIIGGQAYLREVVIADGRPRTVTFATDLMGQVIKRDEQDNTTGGDPHEIWYRFGGRQQGYVGNNGSIDTTYAASIASRTAAPGTGAFFNGSSTSVASADFDLAHDQINSYAQGSRGGTYVVQAGDTLASIAAALWGDADLWYKLAEINGLTAESELIEGQPLLIPAGVQRNSNTADTYKPYDPLEVLGNLSPTAAAPPRGKKGCGGLGQALLAVIAIVVVAIVAPYASGAINALVNGGTLAGANAMGMAAVNGALAQGIVGTGSAIAGGVIGGAAASIASQGVGVMTGIQDKFSWNAVALSAIGAGVGGAVGGGSNIATSALRQSAANAITQGIGAATGLQDKFSWAGVATAGVGTAAGGLAARNLPGAATANTSATFSNRLGASAASLLADAASRSLIEGTDFGDNVMAALPNVAGSLIGNMIVGGVSYAREPEGSWDGGGAKPYGSKQTRLEESIVVTGQRPQRRGILSRIWGGVQYAAGVGFGFLEDTVGGLFSLGDFIVRDVGGSVLYGANELIDLAWPGDLPNPYRQSWDDLRNANSAARNLIWRTLTDLPDLAGEIGDAYVDARRASNDPNLSPFEQGRINPDWKVVGAVVPFVASVRGARIAQSIDRVGDGARAADAATDAARGVDEVTAAAVTGRFGRFGSADALAAELTSRYQAFYDEGYDIFDGAARRGDLTAPDGVHLRTVVGQRTDAFARDAVLSWVESERLADDVVLINRRLYEPGEGLAYRVPDIHVPEANLILDGTIGWKWGSTAQISDFRAFSGATIVVVRPSALGGPYTPLRRS